VTKQGENENVLLDYAGFLVRRMWQIHIAMFLQETKGSGMTPLQFSILLVLQRDPDLEQVELAYRIGIDRSNLSEILSRMVGNGLVKCSPSQQDRRAKVARVTAKGQQLIRKLSDQMERSHELLLEDLSVQERAQFMKLMKKVVAAKNKFGRTRFSMRDSG
jgi:DNA-binding MarR family transcriptional regulator